MPAIKGKGKGAKAPKSSKKDEALDEMHRLADEMIEQNKECLEVIREQRATMDKLTEALAESSALSKRFLGFMDEKISIYETPNYIY